MKQRLLPLVCRLPVLPGIHAQTNQVRHKGSGVSSLIQYDTSLSAGLLRLTLPLRSCCSVRKTQTFKGAGTGPSHSLRLPSGKSRIDSKKNKKHLVCMHIHMYRHTKNDHTHPPLYITLDTPPSTATLGGLWPSYSDTTASQYSSIPWRT